MILGKVLRPVRMDEMRFSEFIREMSIIQSAYTIFKFKVYLPFNIVHRVYLD